MGAAAAPELAGPDSGSTQNAYTRFRREQMAMGPNPHGDISDHTWAALHAEAARREALNRNLGPELVQRILGGPTGSDKGVMISDLDNAILGRYITGKERERSALQQSATAADLRGDHAARDAFEAQHDAIVDELNFAYDAAEQTGTALGRALNARKMAWLHDLSLVQMKRMIERAKGDALTADESGKIAELHRRIAELQGKLDGAQKALAIKGLTRAVDVAVRHIAKRQGRKSPEAKAAEESVADVLGDPGEDFAALVKRLARANVNDGINERDTLMAKVHKDVDGLFPGVTEHDVRLAFSDYGKNRPYSTDAIDMAVAELRGQVLQVLKHKSMLAGNAPEATGNLRQPPGDEQRRLIKIGNELKKTVSKEAWARRGITLKNPLDTLKTRWRNQIADFERQLAAKRRDIVNRKQTKYEDDPEAVALKAQRDELRSTFEAVFKTRGLTDEQRLAMATRAVEKSLAEYERRIRESDFSITPQARHTSPELEALRARRDAEKAHYEELRALDPQYQADQITKQTNAYVSHLTDRIARLLERQAKRDYDVKRKKPKPELNADQRKIQDQVNELAKTFMQEVKEHRERNTLNARLRAAQQTLTTGLTHAPTPKVEPAVAPDIAKLRQQVKIVERAVELRDQQRMRSVMKGAWQATGLLRLSQTTGEFSFIGRQGGKVALQSLVNPFVAKRFMEANIASFKAFASDAYTRAADEAIFKSDNLVRWAESGIRLLHEGEHISGTEEIRIANWIDRLYVIKNFNRAARVWFNTIRTGHFDALTNGRNFTPDQLQRVAHAVNVMTGYGSLGAPGSMGEMAMPLLNELLYSPRNLAASFQYLTLQPLLRSAFARDAATTRLIASQYAQQAVGLIAFYWLASFTGADISWDSNSADFGKLRFGNTRLDPLMGLSQWWVLIHREATGEMTDSHGRTVPIRGKVPFGHPRGDAILGRFVLNKLSPNISLGMTALTGLDHNFQEPTLGSEAGLFVPITYNDVYKAMQDQGIPKGTAMGLAAFFGYGLQTYSSKNGGGSATTKTFVFPP